MPEVDFAMQEVAAMSGGRLRPQRIQDARTPYQKMRKWQLRKILLQLGADPAVVNAGTCNKGDMLLMLEHEEMWAPKSHTRAGKPALGYDKWPYHKLRELAEARDIMFTGHNPDTPDKQSVVTALRRWDRKYGEVTELQPAPDADEPLPKALRPDDAPNLPITSTKTMKGNDGSITTPSGFQITKEGPKASDPAPSDEG